MGHGRGFPEGGHVLALHWYDSEALGVVLQLGLCMRLMVLDLAMEVREQVGFGGGGVGRGAVKVKGQGALLSFHQKHELCENDE